MPLGLCKNGPGQQPTPVQLYAFFLIVCVLALFLRGAVLAVLTEAAGWSPRIAIFFAIASAAIVNFVGLAFFVFPHKSREPPRRSAGVFLQSV